MVGKRFHLIPVLNVRWVICAIHIAIVMAVVKLTT